VETVASTSTTRPRARDGSRPVTVIGWSRRDCRTEAETTENRILGTQENGTRKRRSYLD
jgi:hypothetical protein